MEKLNTKIVYLASAVSVVLGLLTIVVTHPWTDGLGVSMSPVRIWVEYPVTILIFGIPAILLALLFSKNQKWIAPPGRYSPDVKYDPFSTYTLIATALAAAIFAVGGLSTGVNIDLADLITSFTAVYFGPLVTFLAFFIGFFIRWAIGGVTWLPSPILAPAMAFLDAGAWAVNSYLYWLVMRSDKFVKTKNVAMRYVMMAIMIGVMIFVYIIVGIMVAFAIVLNPWAAAIGYITYSISTWIPTAIVFITIGVVIADSLYESRSTTSKMVE